MFRASSNFDKLLDKATSHLLMEPEWDSILKLCDLIRQNDVQAKIALASIKKKLFCPNQHTALYALMVLESMVKNCGSAFHEELSTRAFSETLYELAKGTTHENVRQKLLELIQAWNFAFRKNSQHAALKDVMITLKNEGYKFPTFHESDAMFSADSAPEWADGDVCHRCRVNFSLILRKHHCRACGQVFCNQCSQKSTTLPKYGIEKEVRVCDACYDTALKPSGTGKSTTELDENELPPEYINSSLAQQSQVPLRKTEDELREDEELQLVLALSQSEAEAKEKQKNFNVVKKPKEPLERSVSPAEEETNTELAKYLNRSYWESVQNDTVEVKRASPSAPSPAISTLSDIDLKLKENVVQDLDLENFISTLKTQLEIFINRMKSNSSRGRSITNDTSVQTLFLSITAMHSRLFRYIQQHDDTRLHYERLQDKLTQMKDARAALDDLRQEHREKLRREAEEAERLRQLQMAHKLEIMRKKKQEYLQYQRQLALQRIQEQEREMQMRQEHQKQQYLLSYSNTNQFPPSQVPPPSAGMPPQTMPYPHHYLPIGASTLHQNSGHINPAGPQPNFPQMPGLYAPHYPMPVASYEAPGLSTQPNTLRHNNVQIYSENVDNQGHVVQPNGPDTKTAELISFDD